MVGHGGTEGVSPRPDAKSPGSLARSWTGCWPARRPRPPSTGAGLPDGPKGALAERALNAGMGHRPAGDGGESNGRKGVVTDTGRIASEAPRGRHASFDPQPIAK